MNEDELNSREAATMLGVSERTVLYAVKRGELAATPTQKGKKRYWRFSRKDVEAYLQRIHDQPTNTSEV